MHPFAQARKHKRTHASYAIIACHAAGPLQKENRILILNRLQDATVYLYNIEP